MILFLHTGLFYFSVSLDGRRQAIHCSWICIFSLQETSPGRSRISQVQFQVPKREHLESGQVPTFISSYCFWGCGCMWRGVMMCKHSWQVPTWEGLLRTALWAGQTPENSSTAVNHTVLTFWYIFSACPPLSGLLPVTFPVGLSFKNSHYRLFSNMKESTFSIACFLLWIILFSLIVTVVFAKCHHPAFYFKAVVLS